MGEKFHNELLIYMSSILSSWIRDKLPMIRKEKKQIPHYWNSGIARGFMIYVIEV